MKKFLVCLLVTMLLAASVHSVEVVNDEADRGGQARYSAFKKVTFWVSSHVDLDSTVSATTEPIYGYIDRLVVSATPSGSSDPEFFVWAVDENLASVFSSSALMSTASSPYSYAIMTDDINGDPHLGRAVGGELTFYIASGEDLASASAILYYRDYWK